MKTYVTVKMVLCVTAIALAMAACTPAKEESDGLVNASFSMTGSAGPATVAENKLQKIIDWLIPQALAFMPVSLVDSGGLTVTLTEGWIVVKEIEFEGEEVEGADETDGDEVEFRGPYAVDLLSDTPSVLDTAAIPAIPFKRIKMKLHRAESAIDGAPAQLINSSIYFAGTVNGNSFTYESDDTTEFEIAGPNPVVPQSGSEILVQIQLANVIKQIDMSGVPNGASISSSNRYAGANLCPSIDPSADDVYTCVRNGLREHADWGDDLDGDCDLDDEDESVDE